MSSILTTVLVATLAGLIVWASVHSERRRKARKRELEEQLAILAQELGGEFRPHGYRKRDDWSADGRRPDLRFLRVLPYLDELVRLESTRIENLIALREDKVDAYAFELVSPSEGRRAEIRYPTFVVRLTSRLPNLLIWPIHTPLAGTAHSLDMPVVGTEWAEFNRRYKVRSPMAREAHGFLTPEMMELLIHAEPCHWAIGGCYLYAIPYGTATLGQVPTTSDQVERIRANLAMVRHLARLIPSYILEEGETGHRWPSPLA